jgi:hypothetical protein
MSSPLSHIAGDSIERHAAQSTSLRIVVNQIFGALRDGLVSMHHYEDLRAHGIPHATAAKAACAFRS